MVIDGKFVIRTDAVASNLRRLTNQIYKLLPHREENLDWHLPLETITEEICGMSKILTDYHEDLFAIICKLEGLHFLTEEENFGLYRRTIFECLNAVAALRDKVLECQD